MNPKYDDAQSNILKSRLNRPDITSSDIMIPILNNADPFIKEDRNNKNIFEILAEKNCRRWKIVLNGLSKTGKISPNQFNQILKTYSDKSKSIDIEIIKIFFDNGADPNVFSQSIKEKYHRFRKAPIQETIKETIYDLFENRVLDVREFFNSFPAYEVQRNTIENLNVPILPFSKSTELHKLINNLKQALSNKMNNKIVSKTNTRSSYVPPPAQNPDYRSDKQFPDWFLNLELLKNTYINQTITQDQFQKDSYTSIQAGLKSDLAKQKEISAALNNLLNFILDSTLVDARGVCISQNVQSLKARYKKFFGDCLNFAIFPYAKPISVILQNNGNFDSDLACIMVMYGTILGILPVITAITIILSLCAAIIAVLAMPLLYIHACSQDSDPNNIERYVQEEKIKNSCSCNPS